MCFCSNTTKNIFPEVNIIATWFTENVGDKSCLISSARSVFPIEYSSAQRKLFYCTRRNKAVSFALNPKRFISVTI